MMLCLVVVLELKMMLCMLNVDVFDRELGDCDCNFEDSFDDFVVVWDDNDQGLLLVIVEIELLYGDDEFEIERSLMIEMCSNSCDVLVNLLLKKLLSCECILSLFVDFELDFEFDELMIEKLYEVDDLIVLFLSLTLVLMVLCIECRIGDWLLLLLMFVSE